MRHNEFLSLFVTAEGRAVKLRRRKCGPKQEAGEYDWPEMSSRCVDGVMGGNQEAAPPRLDVDRGKTDKKQEGWGDIRENS